MANQGLLNINGVRNARDSLSQSHEMAKLVRERATK
jgi:hypothetical protein